MKYHKNMARPRQWRKKFTNIHTELRAAHRNYVKRANVKRNSMAMARQSYKKKAFIHKLIPLQRQRLQKYIRTRAAKRPRVPGGHKIWNGRMFRKKYFR